VGRVFVSGLSILYHARVYVCFCAGCLCSWFVLGGRVDL
jgi:hypothetical protein